MPLIIDRLIAGGFVLADVERALGLSRGYLSKVRHEKVKASFQLEALLRLVDDAPRATLTAIAHHQGVTAPRKPSPDAPSTASSRSSPRPHLRALALLKDLAPKLNEQRVRWALTGARAMAAHGVRRDTVDVDILVHSDDRHALSIIREHGVELGFFSDEHVFCFPPGRKDPNDKLDIHFPRLPPLDAAVSRPDLRMVTAATLPVVPALDLAVWKLMSPTAKDQADAAALISLGVVDRDAAKDALTRLLPTPEPRDPYARRLFAPSRALKALEIGA